VGSETLVKRKFLMKLNDFWGKIDALNNLTTASKAVLWCERIAFIFLTVMILFAPHSIAVTQSAWLIGMLAWVLRLFFKPRPVFKLTAIHYALLAFFLWSVISSFFSYAPDISLDKLRGVSLLLIFYFVYHNLRTLRAARFLALALIFSTMFAVLWTPVERIIGRGVEIYDFRGSAFDQIGLQEGDAVLQINGKKVNSLEEMRQKIFENPHEPQFKALIYRADAYTPVEIPRERIKPAASAEESLGIGRWKRSRNWRAAGFYGHFTTFAEVLQMILSLTFGIFIAVFSTPKSQAAEKKNKRGYLSFLHFSFSHLLVFCLLAMVLALLLTATRASQLAFLISSVVIVLLNGNRKIMLTLAVLLVPAAIVALVYLQASRRVGFFDSTDNSITWRQTVYREGFNLWTSSARNLTVGVGMDSIKRYARDWHLFDDGRLPMGHFHSTPLQLLVERGLPALIIWLTILGIYARTLWRGLREEKEKRRKGEKEIFSSVPPLLVSSSSIERGIILGAFGGLVGFFTSGLVHYNLGDGEVAMVFYILMGLSVFVCRMIGNENFSRG
jgi:hypothetical protein